MGYGLLTSNGQLWLKQRRLIQPAFHKQKLEKLIEIISSTVKEELLKIKTNEFIDVYPIMNELAFNVVAKSLFSFSSDKETLRRLQFIIAELQDFIVKELRQPHKRWWLNLTGQVKKKLKLSKESRQLILNIINKRRESNETHDDLLDMLLAVTYEDDGSVMSDEQLIDEILILFVAGHETTANALTFATYLLANNTQYIAQIREESKEIQDTSLSIGSLAQLPVAKAVVDETMRLYPPAWITDRVAVEDDDLGKYQIEKGAIIGISFYEIHRDPRHWNNPNDFFPERFVGEEAKKHSKYYYPFGAGPRMCIGNNFAIYEMLLTLVNLLNNFDLESSDEEMYINPLVTLRPVNAKVKFKKLYE